ncbi:MAG: hypothetical protein ABI995_00645, partial [Acidobacteriota bacterium]
MIAQEPPPSSPPGGVVKLARVPAPKGRYRVKLRAKNIEQYALAIPQSGGELAFLMPDLPPGPAEVLVTTAGPTPTASTVATVNVEDPKSHVRVYYYDDEPQKEAYCGYNSPQPLPPNQALTKALLRVPLPPDKLTELGLPPVNVPVEVTTQEFREFHEEGGTMGISPKPGPKSFFSVSLPGRAPERADGAKPSLGG